MKVRVFQNSDGSVRILCLNPRRPEGNLDKETEKDTSLAGLPFVDVEQESLPPTHARRHAWRIFNGQVVDDTSVPDRVDREADRRKKIAAANTLPELKAALLL